MAKTDNNTLITITPLNIGFSPSYNFFLIGDATYGPSGSGAGGWQIVDRPKRVAATQWFDRSPWSLQFEVYVDQTKLSGFNPDSVDSLLSIEGTCGIIESWSSSIPGTLEPPIFSVTGPVPGSNHIWLLYSTEFLEAQRHPQQGYRYQQHVKFTFYEYSPPFGSLSSTWMFGPAETYNYNASAGTQTFNTYIIKSGDTLQKIVTNHFPQVSVQRIQALNNIRDPQNLIVGQTIIVPSSS